jgi:hypothetical protein
MPAGREAVLGEALGRFDAESTRYCAYTDARDAGRRSVIRLVSLKKRTGMLI